MLYVVCCIPDRVRRWARFFYPNLLRSLCSRYVCFSSVGLRTRIQHTTDTSQNIPATYSCCIYVYTWCYTLCGMSSCSSTNEYLVLVNRLRTRFSFDDVFLLLFSLSLSSFALLLLLSSLLRIYCCVLCGGGDSFQF